MQARKTDFARGGLSLANRIARPFDALAAADASAIPEPIMVSGLPRSGTTLVYELLVQAFEVGFLTRLYSYTYGLPNLTTRLVAQKIRNPYARYDSMYGRIPGRYAPAENAVFWDRWFAEGAILGHHVPAANVSERDSREAETIIASMSKIAQRPYVFKNIYMALSVPAFLRLLPASRVIVVTRDIEAVSASVYNMRKSLSGWWSIRPPLVSDVKDGNTLEQTTFQCIRAQQLLEYSLMTVPSERIMLIDYASICANPHKFIEDVAHWAGSGLTRRLDGQAIPDSFDRSAGPGFSDKDKAEFGTYMEPLQASSQQYLSRVDGLISEHPTCVGA